MHPLIEDLSDLADDVIESKILELSKKYLQSSHNEYLQAQVHMLLGAYQYELDMRRRRAWEELLQKQDKNIDKLINID